MARVVFEIFHFNRMCLVGIEIDYILMCPDRAHLVDSIVVVH